MPSISRRDAVGFMGVGVVAAGLVTGGAEAPAVDAAVVQEALGAVRVGTKFARWTVTGIQAQAGALSLTVAGEDGKAFDLEVMARDSSLAARPPAETDHLAVYVRNGGDGWLPTAEEQGLAAMTLADVITTQGLSGRIEGLLTHSQRIAMHRDVLMGSAA